jgi:hypothetical protein
MRVLFQQHFDQSQEHKLFALLLFFFLLSCFLFFPQTLLLCFNLCVKLSTSFGCFLFGIGAAFLFLRVRTFLAS